MIDKKNLILMLIQRSWQGLSGLITLVLIAKHFTPLYQGWYYTFASLAALFYIFDLGLSNVIILTSAHFFANLKWLKNGKVAGKKSLIFNSFLIQSTKKYLYLSLLFCILLIPFGIIFFQHSNAIHSPKIGNWLAPWIALIVLSSCNSMLSPYLSIIEGSGKIKEILLIKLCASMLGSIICWYLIINNTNLWSLIALPTATLLLSFFWLLENKKGLLVKKDKDTGLFNWKAEIRPFHRQVGISSLSTYFSSQIFIPILFYISGAATAGQMGVSLTIANMLCLLAQSWITYQVPNLGRSAARKEWIELDVIFTKSSIYSVIFYIFGSLVLFIFYSFFIPTDYKSKMLSIWPFAGVIISVFLNHIVWIFSSHIRSFKKEPFALITLLSALISMPLAIIGAYKYSVNGTVVSMLLVQVFFSLPASLYIWNNFKREFKRISL